MGADPDTGIASSLMHTRSIPPDLPARARAALAGAAGDPLLDGLVGWYAMEASHLGAASDDLGGLVAALAGDTRNAHLYAGFTAGELAAAGVLRAAARTSFANAA